MIAVQFTRLIVALCTFVVSSKARDSSHEFCNDVILKLLVRMETMETKMKEMECSMQAEIRILNNDLFKQKEETERLKGLITLVRAEKHNMDNFRIPKQNNDVEFDSKAMNNGGKKSKLEFHIRQASSEPVAFSVYITDYVRHLGINQAIEYDGVLTNEGNVYNAHTGIFTCPQDGLYLTFFVTTINNQSVWVQLMVDDVNVSDAVSYSLRDSQDDQGGNVAILRLRMGQSVWTSTHYHGDSILVANTEFQHMTFSGVRLSA
ncbi:hypothetical protein CHS0354_012233 [Potamilus streckersoni]|uniref:C1q domain-containing protein n=1 Tax=Potamilus streckersoni TaxID=2493646 RepID=A0AAE0SAI5_9BIVA|nr:hypothetical protein CHS0354_012233 [Potamilus streckersoni]